MDHRKLQNKKHKPNNTPAFCNKKGDEQRNPMARFDTELVLHDVKACIERAFRTRAETMTKLHANAAQKQYNMEIDAEAELMNVSMIVDNWFNGGKRKDLD